MARVVINIIGFSFFIRGIKESCVIRLHAQRITMGTMVPYH